MKIHIALLLTLFSLLASTSLQAEASKPNIMLILVDDMGYSDLGCFGSEIATPHLDKLAAGGIRFTNFTNCAKCETTRTTLMSGRYHTEVNRGKDVVTIPEVLSLGGYQRYMVGKWHIFDHPNDRGYERFFGFINGATNFFNVVTTADSGECTLEEDKKPVKPHENFYCTTDFTDKALTYIDERDRKKPFFMYVAYNAPHYPLQAPKDQVMKYRGKYMDGWAALRAKRYEGLKRTGIIPQDFKLPEHSQQDWNNLTDEEKDWQDLRMATYAAMIDMVDQNVGRLIEKLKSEKIYEDTLILFFSDNGACPFERTKKETKDNGYMPWDVRSFYCYNKSWANACNTPWRLYKQNQHEGGISTAMIAHWPKGIKNPGRFDRDRAHLVDIHATFRDLAGVEYPKTFNGREVGPARGLSLANTFKEKKRPLHDEIYHNFSDRYTALIKGNYKIVNQAELYDLSKDRIESNDLSSTHPEKFEAMKKRFVALDTELGGTYAKKAAGRAAKGKGKKGKGKGKNKNK